MKNERPGLDRIRRKVRNGVATTLATAAFASCSVGAATEREDKPEHQVAVIEQAHPAMREIHAVMLDDPSTLAQPSVGELTTHVAQVNDGLMYSSDDTLGVRIVETETEIVSPDTLVATQSGQEKPCHSSKALEQLATKKRIEKNLSDSAFILVIATDTMQCEGYNEQATMMGYVGVLDQKAYMVLNKIDKQYTIHEMGHMLGRPHAANLRAKAKDGRDYSIFDYATWDAPVTYEFDPGYFEMLLKMEGTEQPDEETRARLRERSSTDTIMGQIPAELKQLFTVPELIQMGSDRFALRDVPLEPGEYEIMMQKGGYAGIKLPASEDLRKIIPGSTEVVISLQESDRSEGASIDDNDASYKVVVTTQDSNAFYTVGQSMEFPTVSTVEMINHNKQLRVFSEEPISDNYVYVDRERGLLVSAELKSDGKTMVVRIDDEASSIAKRYELEEELARRVAGRPTHQ